MKHMHTIGKYYVGYVGPIDGILSTHAEILKHVYGRILTLFETTNFGWCTYEDGSGTHLLCLG